jgi:hypothetical protein
VSITQFPVAAHPSVVPAVRAVWHLLAVVAITTWGVIAWPLPLPGVLVGIGALVLSVLIWALFLSPRPVLPTDRFGRSLVELIFLAGAVAAAISIGVPWVIAAAYGVIGAVFGYLAPRSAK